MTLPVYVVDAFTDRPFAGNPAAVVPLEGGWLPDEQLQAIAAEMNLSETAFLLPEDGAEDGWQLRWFSPTVEVELCGHATLAAAFVIFNHLRPGATRARFATCSGSLGVTAEAGRLVLDFPVHKPRPQMFRDDLTQAIGREPRQLLLANDNFIAVFDTEAEIRALVPHLGLLAQMQPRRGLLLTAPGDAHDFVSRCFFPAWGIAEDPVTGSAHCSLVPYWAKRLGKTELTAFQASQRGGTLYCRLDGDRVAIGGQAVLVLEGRLTV